MKLGIKVIWTKVESSEGVLYQSELKILDKNEKLIKPEQLFCDLDGEKLNEVLYLKYKKDRDGDPCIYITNGNTYTSKNFYIQVNNIYKKGISSSPEESEILQLKSFFEAINEEFEKAITNLKSKTLIFKY